MALVVQPNVPEAVATFLTGYDGNFEFLTSMKARYTAGHGLSEGMVSAIQRCIVRADEQEQAKAPDPDGIDLFTLPEGKSFHAIPTREGGMHIVRVDRPKQGNWVGWVFLKQEPVHDPKNGGRQQVGGTYTGRMRGAASRISRNWLASCKRYGTTVGKCGLCNRRLSVADARTGMGKSCLKRAEDLYASNRET